MNKKNQDVALLGGVLLVVLLAARPGNAIDWVNGLALGDFDAGTSWVGGVAPGLTDSADFVSLSASATVRYDGINPITDSMLVDNADVTLRSFSHQQNKHTITNTVKVYNISTLTLGNASSTPLNLDARTVDIRGGSVFSAYFGSDVWANSLSAGTLSVTKIDGPGSTLTVSGPVLIGLMGSTGTLNFTNGSTGHFVFGPLSLGGGFNTGTTGILNVTGGSQLTTKNTYVGSYGAAGQSGTILLDGTGSRITQPGYSTLTIGSSSGSQGDVTIGNGGVFDTGTGPTKIHGLGTLTVNSGGTFDANGPIEVNGGEMRVNAGGTLDLTDGQTLTATSGGLVRIDPVYRMGSETFDINGGAELATGNFYVGFGGDGTLTVDGAGSQLTVTGFLQTGAPPYSGVTTIRNGAAADISGELAIVFTGLTGQTASGTVNVESGADMTVGSAILIASNDGVQGTGTLNIMGAGSTLTQSGTLPSRIGNAGGTTATINITDSGRLTTNAAAVHINPTGTVNVNTGGVIELNGDLNINGGRVNVTNGGLLTTNAITVSLSAPGEVNVNTGGMLVIGDGAPVGSSDRVEVTANGVLKGNGTVNVAFGLTNTGGTVAPGLSVGTMTVNGVFTNGGDPSATLEIEIDSPGAAGTDYDQLIVSGAAFTDGTLDFQLGGAYGPTLGDEFDFLIVGGAIVSTFDAITNVAHRGGLGLAVRYGYDPGQVDMRVSLRGDVDFDDDIDTGDLTTAIANFNGAGGSGNSWINGDFDGDGDTDTGDLTFAISKFTGASAANANVPDLLYDPATGNVTIDADGADVISFSLQSGPFNAADFSELPAGLTDNIASQIGWTSFNLFSGLTSTANLGAILPAGLDAAGLEAALTTASYGLALAGGGGGRLDIIIPEPASIVLMGLGVVALVRRPFRKIWPFLSR